MRTAASTFLRVQPIVLIEEQILQTDKEPGAKPSFTWMDTLEYEFCDDASSKKLRRHVLRLVWTVTLAAKPGVERIPILAAQCLKRFLGFR